MDKVFIPSKFEDEIYEFWEKNHYFTAKVNLRKKPFSIILPLPNANGELHLGHSMFVYEDLMIRYYKLKGYETLWLPGIDHAGIETQFVFEKELQKNNKSRFDYEREELFQMIKDFTLKNKPKIKIQMRRLGFSLDWEKEKFTMDEDIIKIIYKTFKNLHTKGLLYRDKKLVNYCIKNGTSFSDLEVKNKEIVGKLYFIKYEILSGGFIEIATTRPETILGDAAVAVNPKDKRYKALIGKTIILPFTKRKVPIIADESVDIKFGTGALKITPSHDFDDFDISRKHNINFHSIISFEGKIINSGTRYDGMTIKKAREEIIVDLQKENLLSKIKDHEMILRTCYRCGSTLEPLPLEQWFIKIKPLAKDAIDLVKSGRIKIIPSKSKKTLINILDNFIDWNISRQIVWGIKIPAWKCQIKNTNNKRMGFHESVILQVYKGKTKTYRIKDHGFKIGERVAFENSQKKELFGYGTIVSTQIIRVDEINLHDKTHFIVYDSHEELIKALKKHNPYENITKQTRVYIYEYLFEDLNSTDGCGKWIIDTKKPNTCPKCGSTNLIQDKDTFDTWFSSSQWPFASLKSQGSEFFNYFYPTSVMETGYDILRAWVARMIMIGYFETKKPPFTTVYLHGMIRDSKGQKMSKSKGNVIDPIEKVNQYGADAWRASLVFGIKQGADVSLPDEKIVGMRNFINKIWNIGRFLLMNQKIQNSKLQITNKSKILNELKKDFENEKKLYFKLMDDYKFSLAFETIYEFLWHRFADYYIEKLKDELKNGNIKAKKLLFDVYFENLKFLHPFIPFVTDAVWKVFHGRNKTILNEKLS